MQARVLFVSKPIVAPFNDGSKCLVRDVSGARSRYAPRIMGPRGAELPHTEEQLARVYSRPGSFRPALADNARVLLWLLTRAKESLWHFVFAPNARTSQVAKLIHGFRRVRMVQTIASPPRSFDSPERLLFGDVVVAQSQWTRRRFLQAFASSGRTETPKIEVIAPCVAAFEFPTDERKRALRARLQLGENEPVFVYPGDLEVSHGAEWVAAAVPDLVRQLPSARVVFAFRNKSPAAAIRAGRIRGQLPASIVRIVPEVPDIHALLSVATAVLFPVDDLFGKVDIPIVLLEAMRLGTPVISLDAGPLADLQGVLRVSPGGVAALVEHSVRLFKDDGFRQSCVVAQKAAVEHNHQPAQAARRYEAIYDQLLEGVDH